MVQREPFVFVKKKLAVFEITLTDKLVCISPKD